jgi:hypothetical protein
LNRAYFGKQSIVFHASDESLIRRGGAGIPAASGVLRRDDGMRVIVKLQDPTGMPVKLKRSALDAADAANRICRQIPGGNE